jgi:SRSO17 transposase
LACESGLPRGVALMDAVYGRNARLRADIRELNLPYVVGIVPATLMWAPGHDPRCWGERFGNDAKKRSAGKRKYRTC